MANYSEKEIAVERYIYDGTLTKFDFDYAFNEGEDLIVIYGEETKLLNVDYTATPSKEGEGFISLLTLPKLNEEVIIIRRTELTRVTDFKTSARFTADLVDSEYDQLLRQISDNRLTGLNIKVPDYMVGNFEEEIQNFGPNKILSTNTEGNGIESIDAKDLPAFGIFYDSVEGFAEDAETSAIASELSNQESASNLALTNADVIQTNTNVALTNADVVQTNADVLSTQQSVTEAQAVVDSLNLPTITSADKNKVLQVNSNGEYIVDSYIKLLIVESDNGSNLVGLNNNDGYGNSNVYFNHRGGIPTYDGSAARITSTTESTTGLLQIQVGDDVTAGDVKTLNSVANFKTNKIEHLRDVYNSGVTYGRTNIKQTHLTAAVSQTLTANTRATVAGISVKITPSTTSSKVRLSVRWNGEVDNLVPEDTIFGLRRNGIDIGNPGVAGNRNVGMAIVSQSYGGGRDIDSTPESCVFEYIDSPNTTSEVTYTISVIAQANCTLYTNRTVTNGDSSKYERLTTNMIAQEV